MRSIVGMSTSNTVCDDTPLGLHEQTILHEHDTRTVVWRSVIFLRR